MTEAELIGRLAHLVLGVLVTATAVTWGLGMVKPTMRLGEVRARIWAWWVMAPLIFVGVVVSRSMSTAFFCILSLVAFREYLRLLPERPADRTARLLCVLAIPIQYWWIHTGWYMMFVIFIPVYVFLVIPMGLVLSREASGFVQAAAELNWGLMAFVFGLSHLAYMVTCPAPAGSAVTGRAMVLFLIFVVEINDVLQFVWGKTLGRHKILPTISPHKTWEGFVGGTASAVAVSLLLRYLTPFSVVETIAVGALITVAGFFGGAVMSAVKRDFGVKDFGQLIPGHGGVLDRVDSLVYAAPVFFHFVQYFHY
ncbi:MAG TPA: phosphatidate cytidylyltransferase [Candidatus Xenobia bacterium]